MNEWRYIRLFTPSDADYAARNALLATSDPTTTVEKLKHTDVLWDSNFRKQTFLLEVGGLAVATGMYCEWIHWYEPGRYYMKVVVHPAYRRQGHGTALYDTMREYLAKEMPTGRLFMCMCHESEPESIRFVTQRGFQQTGVDQLSVLDLSSFDPERAALATRELREQGIEILSYHELAASDADFLRKFYDLTCLSMKDMPAGGERTYQPFEQSVQSVFEYPGFLPELFFMAVENGRYVGQSDLVDEKQDLEHLGTGYTGVHPDYRRRGIATALKLRCIQAAKEMGAKSISTGNWHTNPMYQVNLKLGFKPLPADVWFELKLE
jgi:GNAT superfamily N-acetyltransferase